MDEEVHKLTLDTKGTASVWRSAAETLGFVIRKGPLVGQGNISAVFNGLADGTITPYELEEAFTKVRRQEVELEPTG